MGEYHSSVVDPTNRVIFDLRAIYEESPNQIILWLQGSDASHQVKHAREREALLAIQRAKENKVTFADINAARETTARRDH